MARTSTFSLLFGGFSVLAAARRCQNLTVEVDISARNGVFDIETPVTDIDVTDFIFEMGTQGRNYSDEHLTGYTTVSGTYELAATYCEPDNKTSDVLQIMSHGVGFDRSYWDYPVNNWNYSYTKVAVDDYGYSTFTWDRLGIAESSRGEPINEIQSWLELAALEKLTNMLRAGEVDGLEDKHFRKIVHVGHSFGSIMAYSMTASNRCISDGIVLTGFSHMGAYMPYFLFAGTFVRANSLAPLADYGDGYIAPAVVSAAQTNLFAPGMYDPEVLNIAFERGQPAAVGEFLTLGMRAGEPSSFNGPALVITGDRDLPFCGGDCSASGDSGLDSLLDLSAEFLSQASPFEAYVVPGAGHGMGFEYSHAEVTGKILDFLVQNGLAAH
ncbi:alpha/beta-hydrolase [Sodiomyces alkalinus F11]|uniref:Alpha/beta-hydrolase n=1 Tax=Sodiomyces alkalinus (strain CBS 110278 / VKM F-3762 / F11) TaxID=1314773 RepID=A0A3N2Q917_SODAK|nr:alpha/beta-hydrolase [Sodiomyces alkalinus F11]ROT43240.1 alpha/beta-hydrolase [Sodiomyces alkalinus F11]